MEGLWINPQEKVTAINAPVEEKPSVTGLDGSAQIARRLRLTSCAMKLSAKEPRIGGIIGRK